MPATSDALGITDKPTLPVHRVPPNEKTHRFNQCPPPVLAESAAYSLPLPIPDFPTPMLPEPQSQPFDHLPETAEWDRAVATANPALLLLVIEQRMGAKLRASLHADDILQESLMHAWRARATFNWSSPQGFRSWLLTIVDHRIRDAADQLGTIKRGADARIGSLTQPGSANDVMPESTTPSRLAWYREQAEAIRAGLSGLPADLADIVRLRLVDQLTISELAEHLRITPAAVRHRFRKGAELLRFRLIGALGSRPPNQADSNLPKSPTITRADSSSME